MSGRQDMRTPQWLFDFLEDYFLKGERFQLDAAATLRNRMCKKYYNSRQNSLVQPWADRTFCNPPFRKMLPWVWKAYNEARYCDYLTVMLAPVGCSQDWWHGPARHAFIYHPDRRISFNMPNGRPTKNADRDTIFMLFSPHTICKRKTCDGWGIRPIIIPEFVP